MVKEVCKLASLQPGNYFQTEIGRFLVREQMGSATGVMMIGCWNSGKSKAFSETGCPDYKDSNIRCYYDDKILKTLEAVFGAENIVEDDVDLTTLNGQKDFGTVRCKVHPPTFDEWRQCNDYFRKGDFKNWFWTCTAWTAHNDKDYSDVAVIKNGELFSTEASDHGCEYAVACLLSPEIMVKKVI